MTFVLLSPPSIAQHDEGTGVVICSRAEYASSIVSAIENNEPTAKIHKAWHGQCLAVYLERARYLDTYLEEAITEYGKWIVAVQKTDDELLVKAENDEALNRLGGAFSDAVDRANSVCIEEDDWKHMERAIFWWSRAMDFDLNTPKYRLDAASFKERLCGKIHYDIITGDPRIGYGPYSFHYRIGIRLGNNEPRYDVPLDKAEPVVEGGHILKDEKYSQKNLDRIKEEFTQFEAELAAAEAAGELEEGASELLAILLGPFAEVEALLENSDRLLDSRWLSILPENNETGVSIKIAASMKAIPFVDGKFIQNAKQNPYRGSRWRFRFNATEVHSLHDEERGDTEHDAVGEFTVVWPDKESGSTGLSRNWSNYKSKLKFKDYARRSPDGGCKEYLSPTFALDGEPHLLLDESDPVITWGLVPPDNPLNITVVVSWAPYINVAPSDPKLVPMVLLRPLFQRGDNYWFEYEVDCWRYGLRDSRRDYKSEREYAVAQVIQAALPLENRTANSRWASSNGSERWSFLTKLQCLSDCPTPEDLEAPKRAEAEPPEEDQEDDLCDPASIVNHCDSDLRSTISKCSKLRDWKTTYGDSWSSEPRSYCSDLGCSAANARSAANPAADVFDVIKNSTDEACPDEQQTSSSITCRGYHE